MATFGARLGGAVQHVINRVGDVSACGRIVLPGKGAEARMCRTCVRINEDARRVDDKRRKAARDARLSTAVAGDVEYLSWEYHITAHELEMTREKIAKINARCAKRGIPGGFVIESEERNAKEKNEFGVEIERVFFAVTIKGIAPQLPGYEFIGTIDFDRNAGLITRGYPGATQIDRALIREGWCDHCQVNRYRKQTMVVRNTETGEQIQVGATCIKDFTGWSVMPYSARSMQQDMEEIGGFYGGGTRDVTTLTVLGVAWACVQTWGFVPSRDMGATRDRVQDVINPPKPSKGNAEWREELARVRELAGEMEEKAIALRAFIASEDFAGDSEYVLNLKAIAKADKVSAHNYGILCSAPQAWARFTEKSLIRKAEKSNSEWQGDVKEKITRTVKVESVRYIENDYGTTTAVIRMMDESGNVYTWFSSGKSDWLEKYEGEDETITITGTVKKHDEFKGHKSTVLLRVKAV